MLRIYSLTPKNRVAAVALGIGVVGAGVLLVFVGFALLAALTVAGAVLGTGVAVYRWLRPGRALPVNRQHPADLDPALEIHAPVRVVAAPVDRADPNDRDEPPVS